MLSSSHATNSASMDSLSQQAAGAQQRDLGYLSDGTVRAQIGLASRLESRRGRNAMEVIVVEAPEERLREGEDKTEDLEGLGSNETQDRRRRRSTSEWR
jgi:hypothetical protein